jgi:hypothetical protein
MPSFLRIVWETRGGRRYPGLSRRVFNGRVTARRGRYIGNHAHPRRFSVDPHPESAIQAVNRPAGLLQIGGIRLFPLHPSQGTGPGQILVIYCEEGPARKAEYHRSPSDLRSQAGWTKIGAAEGYKLVTGVDYTSLPPTDPDYDDLKECAYRGYFPDSSGEIQDLVPAWVLETGEDDSSGVEEESTSGTADTAETSSGQ